MPGPAHQPPAHNPTDWAPSLLLYARSPTPPPSTPPTPFRNHSSDSSPSPLLPTTPAPGFFRILRNLVLSASRHDAAARRARPRLFVPASNSAAPVSATNLAAALEQLPHDAREILVLKIWASLTFDQIAAITSLPPATAHRRFRESLAQLRAALESPCNSPTTNLKA